jgi:hypothetical protein
VTAATAAGQPTITIEYDRASFAGSFDATLLSTEDLSSWTVTTDLNQVVAPLDAHKEHVRATAARDAVARFFRIGTSQP